MRTILAVAAALALSGGALAGPNEEALMAADAACAAQAASEGAVAAYAACAAPDLRLFDDEAGMISDDAGISKVLADRYPAGGSVSWTPSEAVASDDGTMGFTVGTWSYSADGVDQSGSYVTVWRKQGDGSWKIAVDADTAKDDAE